MKTFLIFLAITCVVFGKPYLVLKEINATRYLASDLKFHCLGKCFDQKWIILETLAIQSIPFVRIGLDTPNNEIIVLAISGGCNGTEMILFKPKPNPNPVAEITDNQLFSYPKNGTVFSLCKANGEFRRVFARDGHLVIEDASKNSLSNLEFAIRGKW